ncbi:MAG: uroporphyrinogen-III synthase [Hyphomicrobiales bacterium]|nr:uroporphyrinogen-III synthase [Hyphomicrobiales bacterium]
MTTGIALFRAPAAAAVTAGRLRRLGFAVVSAPVIETVARPFSPKRTSYDAIVATSANAFLADAAVERNARVYVVGARTARAAEARGWRLAAPPAPDAQQLVATLMRDITPGAHTLYLAGRDRKAMLEDALGAVASLETVEAYAAEARAAWRAAETRDVAACSAALHYSSRSAALAARLAEAAGILTSFADMRHVCLSPAAAAPLGTIGAQAIFIAATPDEPALFDALRQAMAIFPSDRPYRI